MVRALATLFFAVLASGLSAQLRARPGIRAGSNQSTLTNLEVDYRSGFYVGVFAHLRFSPMYTMQPEIGYSAQGARSRSLGLDDIKINYITLALANKLFVSKNAGLHFILGPGLDVNYDNNPIRWVNTEFGTEGRLTGIDLTVFGGIGYEFPFGLILEARFKQGLLDVDLWSNDFDNDGQAVINQVFQIGTAYKFDF